MMIVNTSHKPVIVFRSNGATTINVLRESVTGWHKIHRVSGFPDDRGAGLNGKYFFRDDLAALGQLSFSQWKNENNSSAGTLSNDTNSITLADGVRKYFYKKEVSIFGDTLIFAGYGKGDSHSVLAGSETTSDSKSQIAGVTAELGGEYFFSANASLGAKFGVQYSYASIKTNSTSPIGISDSANSKTSEFGTTRGVLEFNYYW